MASQDKDKEYKAIMEVHVAAYRALQTGMFTGLNSTPRLGPEFSTISAFCSTLNCHRPVRTVQSHPDSDTPFIASWRERNGYGRKFVSQLQRLTALLTPAMHKQELKRLDEDANVFKMIGPVLLKQDLVEAKSNVGKRIEYIKGEVSRVDGQIKSLETKSKDKENEVGGP